MAERFRMGVLMYFIQLWQSLVPCVSFYYARKKRTVESDIQSALRTKSTNYFSSLNDYMFFKLHQLLLTADI